VHALDERGGTVADADDAYADVAHMSSFSSITCCRSWGRSWYRFVPGRSVR
jgi:hypothetical protein